MTHSRSLLIAMHCPFGMVVKLSPIVFSKPKFLAMLLPSSIELIVKQKKYPVLLRISGSI